MLHPQTVQSATVAALWQAGRLCDNRYSSLRSSILFLRGGAAPPGLLAPTPRRVSGPTTTASPRGSGPRGLRGRTRRGRALPDNTTPARVPAESPAAPAGGRPGAPPGPPRRAAAPAALARSSAFPRSLAPRTRPPVPQGPSRPPWRLSMIRRRVARGCHGGRRRVGRSCSQSRGKSLKPRKKGPSRTVGGRGNEPRPRGGGRVTGGGPPAEPQAGPPRFYAERDVGGGAPEAGVA